MDRAMAPPLTAAAVVGFDGESGGDAYDNMRLKMIMVSSPVTYFSGKHPPPHLLPFFS
ncbi:hypothetical protein Hanom_Chr08g00719321 [Helianthus anomalus]